MSFENKGFPNSLNKQYDSLRARALNYEDAENYYAGQSPFELMAIANQFKKNNQLKTIDTGGKGIVKGGGLSTKDNPAQLPEFVVEAKPKKNKMKYFYYIIAVILIILIYKQFKK